MAHNLILNHPTLLSYFLTIFWLKKYFQKQISESYFKPTIMENTNLERLPSTTVSFYPALWESTNHKKPRLWSDVLVGDEWYKRKSKMGNLIKDSSTKAWKSNKPCNTKGESKETCLSWHWYRVKEIKTQDFWFLKDYDKLVFSQSSGPNTC